MRSEEGEEMEEVERKILVFNLEFWFFLNQGIKNKLTPLSLSLSHILPMKKPQNSEREGERKTGRERESLEPSNFVFRSDLLLREKSHGSCELNVVHYSFFLSFLSFSLRFSLPLTPSFSEYLLWRVYEGRKRRKNKMKWKLSWSWQGRGKKNF